MSDTTPDVPVGAEQGEQSEQSEQSAQSAQRPAAKKTARKRAAKKAAPLAASTAGDGGALAAERRPLGLRHVGDAALLLGGGGRLADVALGGGALR